MSDPVPTTPALTRERLLTGALAAVTVVAIVLCARMTWPFLGAIAWALALAVVCWPLHAWLLARTRRPALAAGLTVATVVIVLLPPAAFVSHRLAVEASETVQRARATAADAGGWENAVRDLPWIGRWWQWADESLDLRAALNRAIGEAATLAGGLAGLSALAFAETVVALYVLFYLLRDRDPALAALRGLMPLGKAEADEVLRRTHDTVYATVIGKLLVSAVQGLLGGLVFWWLGLPAPVLWGVVMGLLSVVPFLGSFVVWAPAAVALFALGETGKALILVAWGSIVIGTIDNVLFPVIVGGRMRLHTIPVFIAVLGGLSVFGASGIVVGPLVLAGTLALFDVWRGRAAGGPTVETPGVPTSDPGGTRNNESPKQETV